MIKRIQGSRKRIRAGMFFRILLLDGRTLLGYVARDDAFTAPGGDWDCFVVYAFRPDAKPDHLTLDDLLVPPLLVTRQTWTYGVFDTSQQVQASITGVPERHCFRSLTGWEFAPDGTKIVSEYFDEYCTPCKRSEPCGIHAVTLIQGIEHDIAEGLRRLDSESQS